MKVYRYLSQDELDAIQSNSIDNIGVVAEVPKEKVNTHNYIVGSRYLHFFLEKSSVNYIKPLHISNSQDYYTCTFDIPIYLLLKYRGRGNYFEIGTTGTKKLEEYAIPLEDFDPASLSDYTLDKDHHNYIERQKEILDYLKSRGVEIEKR